MVMAGEAVKDQPRIASQIDSMKCTEHVFSVEHLTQDELTIAYHASEAVVLPSLYEGFGFSMVEAMASGVPTLGANATSIPGVVGDGGILFDPFDKNDLAENILRVLNDKNLRKDLIVKGLKQAKQFTWEKCAEQTIDIYRKTLV
jgi:glycosyltransferase involved in cell wall biosynthesis